MPREEGEAVTGSYLCEVCLSEQSLTFNDLLLATSAGPLRCPRPGCRGFAYLVTSEEARSFLAERDRTRPLLFAWKRKPGKVGK